MMGLSVLMFVFSVCLILVGLYMYFGNEFKLISWKAAYKGVDKNGWKRIGFWTMVVSIIPFLIGFIALMLYLLGG